MRFSFPFSSLVLAALVCAPLVPAAVAQDDDIESLVEQFKQALEDTKTWTADMTMKMSTQSMTMEWTGDVINKGKQSASNMTMEMMGQKMSMRSVADNDGIMWTEINMAGQIQVMKMDAETAKKVLEESGGMSGLPMSGDMDATQFLKNILDTYQLTAEGKEMLGDVEVYIISATVGDDLKAGLDPEGVMQDAGFSLEKMKLAFGVKDGFVRQYEMMGNDDMPAMTMNYTNVKLNPELDDAVFTYTPPEGAMVQDVAEMMAAMGSDASGGKFALGSPAPEFTGKNLAGEDVSLSDYKGKVVLVDFWATWCGPCVHELPNVIEAYKTYHDKGFEILAVSLDESSEDLETFLKEHPDMTWTQLFDGKGWESEIAAQYEVEAIPFTLLLDKEGNVVRQDLRGEALENALADLLGG